ncbi:AI-2E family transporter [Metasolibacillus sp.]|uniref:AI-2E family transporter n=1 Tax=Metasolibacillus sp. TaxID=2703680 RepID=UPI0025DA41D0|nr:AI-2E family transporter [Metasolibacillus sp.]MCT6925635.1 AI-2E family transporter [Metasolibacillus sp.]MCT6941790.1 AI-2E family transporter [Metasolibacillus sp.]
MHNAHLKFLTADNMIKYLVVASYLLLAFLLLPISLALLCAYLLYPVVQFFYKKFHLPIVISITLTTALCFFIIYQLSAILFQSLLTLIPYFKMHLDTFSTEYADVVFFPLLLEKSFSFIDSIMMSLVSIAQHTFGYLFEFFIFLIVFYFSLFESRKNRLWFFIYVPKKYRAEWQHYFKRALHIFSYFLFVTLQLFIMTFVLLSIGFYLLGFESPISKALLISFADALPFFGIGIFLIPLMIYFYIVGQKGLAIALIALYLFIQLSRQLVESIVWASTFQLRMVHSFVISAASILLFGVYGILLSPFFLLIAVKISEKSIFAR